MKSIFDTFVSNISWRILFAVYPPTQTRGGSWIFSRETRAMLKRAAHKLVDGSPIPLVLLVHWSTGPAIMVDLFFVSRFSLTFCFSFRFSAINIRWGGHPERSSNGKLINEHRQTPGETLKQTHVVFFYSVLSTKKELLTWYCCYYVLHYYFISFIHRFFFF